MTIKTERRKEDGRGRGGDEEEKTMMMLLMTTTTTMMMMIVMRVEKKKPLRLHSTRSPILFYSIQGCVLPLQEVALRQSLPSFSVLCYPRPYRSLLPHNVISPTTFWSSN